MKIFNFTEVKKLLDFETKKLMGYQTIIDGEEWFVPLDEHNGHYIEIMRQVDAGDLTIKEAD